jgi:hypothetical protein
LRWCETFGKIEFEVPDPNPRLQAGDLAPAAARHFVDVAVVAVRKTNFAIAAVQQPLIADRTSLEITRQVHQHAAAVLVLLQQLHESTRPSLFIRFLTGAGVFVDKDNAASYPVQDLEVLFNVL